MMALDVLQDQAMHAEGLPQGVLNDDRPASHPDRRSRSRRAPRWST